MKIYKKNTKKFLVQSFQQIKLRIVEISFKNKRANKLYYQG